MLRADVRAYRLIGVGSAGSSSGKTAMTTYTISSGSSSLLSSIDGETYDTYREAFAACQTVARGGNDDGMVAEEIDYGNEQAWLVYTSQESCDLDRDGSRAVARIETVTADEEA